MTLRRPTHLLMLLPGSALAINLFLINRNRLTDRLVVSEI
jgi:hypothetical protein